MSRSFDKKLVRRIREVFDNHSEPVNRDAWKDMERRLDFQHTRKVVSMYSIIRIAAVVLIFFLVLWPFNHRLPEHPSDREPAKRQNTQKTASSRDTKEHIEDRTGKGEPGKTAQMSPGFSQHEISTPESFGQQQTHLQAIQGRARNSQKQGTIVDSRKQGMEKLGTIHSKIPVSLKPVNLSFAGFPSRRTKSQWTAISVPDSAKNIQQRFNLGVSFSTLYNYASQTIDSDLNYSGGIVSEFKILPRLSMHTGLIVSRQYFTTQNGRYPLPDLDNKHEANYTLSHLESNSNRVELVGLDVPLNIEYQIKNLSLTAGISSFTYIQEQYHDRYSTKYIYSGTERTIGYDSWDRDPVIIRNESFKTSYDPLNRMDLANILNLAVGYHLTFDHSHLVIQPFMKHPLGNLTSRDIRFGSRGIQLKYQF
mgnify:CR=1 FL=1